MANILDLSQGYSLSILKSVKYLSSITQHFCDTYFGMWALNHIEIDVHYSILWTPLIASHTSYTVDIPDRSVVLHYNIFHGTEFFTNSTSIALFSRMKGYTLHTLCH